MKNERGITLIALIITIIILIILAMVSIRAAYNSGIIDYSINGTQKYVEEEKKESSVISGMESLIKSVESKLKEEKDEDDYTQKEEYRVLYNNNPEVQYSYMEDSDESDVYIGNNGLNNFATIDNVQITQGNLNLCATFDTTPGLAYILKKTGELYVITHEAGWGWTAFNENDARKVQDNFKVKENSYQGLDYLCLTPDNRIFNYLMCDYLENTQNIEKWCGSYYITKDGDLYNARQKTLIEENVNLDQWFIVTGYSSDHIYLYTQEKDLYDINNNNVSLISSNLNITEWINPHGDNFMYFLQGNDLYGLYNGGEIELRPLMENVNIKQWYGDDHFITQDNDLYICIDTNGQCSKIADDVDIKYWYEQNNTFYLTQNNNLYNVMGNLVHSNVNIKQWSEHIGYYLTQDNKLYSQGNLLFENIQIKEWLNGDYAFVTTDGRFYCYNLGNNQSWQLLSSNVNIARKLGDKYFLTEEGSLCGVGNLDSFRWRIVVYAPEANIKEWYGGRCYYLTQDNYLCQYDEVIAENCASYDIITNSYITLNDELFINMK